MIIQKATLNDIEAIHRLTSEVSHEIYAKAQPRVDGWLAATHSPEIIQMRLQEPDHLMLVIKEGSTVIASGYASVVKGFYDKPSQTDCVLGGLYIKTDYRRLGLGSQLVRARLAWLETKSAQKVYTSVAADNTTSVAMLTKHGFNIERQDAGEMLFEITWNIMTRSIE